MHRKGMSKTNCDCWSVQSCMGDPKKFPKGDLGDQCFMKKGTFWNVKFIFDFDSEPTQPTRPRYAQDLERSGPVLNLALKFEGWLSLKVGKNIQKLEKIEETLKKLKNGKILQFLGVYFSPFSSVCIFCLFPWCSFSILSFSIWAFSMFAVFSVWQTQLPLLHSLNFWVCIFVIFYSVFFHMCIFHVCHF